MLEVAAKTVHKIGVPAFPMFHFEWHEKIGKVYCVDVPGVYEGGVFYPDLTAATAQAACIAEHADTHGRAYGFVQTYLRGLRKGQGLPKELIPGAQQ